MYPFKTLSNKTLSYLKLTVLVLVLLPFINLSYLAFTTNLGANPIEKMTHVTGYWTLTLLLITLSISPLRQVTGYLWLMRLRRLLGLSVFFYGCVHFSIYLIIDQFFDWLSIGKDIIKRPYITVGFLALVLLLPLAITSNNAMIKRLSYQRWQKLHYLIYPIAILGVLHYWWLVKKDLTNPLIFALLLSFLLAIRLFVYSKPRFKKWRTQKN